MLALAAAFVAAQGLVLTLSPAARERSWEVQLRWSHWVGIAAWLGVFVIAQRLVERALPVRDRFVLPICALLSGLGLVTIWRLDPQFGVRQAAWSVVSAVAVGWLMSRRDYLSVLRKYKYVLLGCGLMLTALTIFFGASPTGVGPRLWLGCCGVYLQPSEPLKLLLVLYLSAYLADHVRLRTDAFPLFFPTLVVTCFALLLLVVQRDLGSASIFILLYTVILYAATERRRVLIGAFIALALAAVTGFFFVSIIQARLESWLNPWADPSARSYQIVQSLLAIANGGIVGRGLGLGNPGLVPVAHSDFIYTAVAEEGGLLGSVGLLVAYAILLTRGFLISIHSTDRFHRLLAVGLTAYLGVQALLIIGGNLRLLPLTGVTLPFVSYGGSSLLTSSVAAAMLLSISAPIPQRRALSAPPAIPHAMIGGALGLGLIAVAVLQAWWAVVRGPDLLSRTDNARRSIADRYVARGEILDRNNTPITVTTGESGELKRVYRFPHLSSVSGYTHPTFGQAGLEASLDGFLRGTQGNPTGLRVWNQLLYGTPPPGLDVRLTIDIARQEVADAMLDGRAGAVVLLNARSGEILAMASHPTYNANQLGSSGGELLRDEGRPLLNRATQGSYALHDAAIPLIAASNLEGAPAALAPLYRSLGFYSAPEIRLPTGSPSEGAAPDALRVSPLQMVVAASTLSNNGVRPVPRIALAVHTPSEGWVVLPALGQPQTVFTPEAAALSARHYAVPGAAIWQWRTTAASQSQTITWYLAGTLPDWQGTPLAVVVLLEDADVGTATRVGRSLLGAASAP